MKIHWVLFFLICLNLNLKAQVSKPILTSRWFHPRDNLDTLNTLAMIKTFKPARIDWTYCDDDKVLKKYRDLNIPYSLAINPQTPDSAGFTTPKTRIITPSGVPYTASWMNWKMNNPYWGCVNNPLFKKIFFHNTVKLINLKPYAILVDDALFNIQLQREKRDMVGCFCTYCVDNFYRNISKTSTLNYLSREDLLPKITKYIESDKKDTLSFATQHTVNLYKTKQNESVLKFLKEWKNKILLYEPSIKTLANNNSGNWEDIFKVFDGGIAELQTKNLNIAFLDSVFNVSDKLGKTQNFTLVSSDEYAQNYLIAYLYAKGRDYFIPWDLFVPNSKSSANRYYTDTLKQRSFLDLLQSKETKIEFRATLDFFDNNNWYNIKKENGYVKIILCEYPLKPRNRKLIFLFYAITALAFSSLLYFISKKIRVSNFKIRKYHQPHLSVE